jgi:radical SAM protein with 4Fe4S-binding SPASM domain
MELPLVVAVTPNAFMTDGEEILRFLHAEGLPHAINSGLMQPRSETGRGLADAGLDTYVSMMKLRASLKGKQLEAEPDPESLPDPNNGEESPEFGVTCGAGRSGFAVDWRGDMRPCNNFPCQGENVLSLGFREAWCRTNYTATHFPLPAECQGCAYQGVCKHCVAEHASGAEPGHASPAICAMGRRMVIEGLVSLNNK